MFGHCNPDGIISDVPEIETDRKICGTSYGDTDTAVAETAAACLLAHSTVRQFGGNSILIMFQGWSGKWSLDIRFEAFRRLVVFKFRRTNSDPQRYIADVH
jgi:hypothetical protein